MQTFFHGGRYLMQPGDIVPAGHYGRMIDLAGHNHFHHARERVLEAVRRRTSSAKPSRLAAIFGCPTEAGLRRYIDEMGMAHPGRVAEMLYEVVPVDAGRPVHHGDWRVPQHLDPTSDERWPARDHWNEASLAGQADRDGDYDEVVTTSALRVIRRCSTAP